jgi:hypothetical protein
LRVSFSSSRALRSSGCTMTPPLAPPKGTSMTAHFQVLMEARLQAGWQTQQCAFQQNCCNTGTRRCRTCTSLPCAAGSQTANMPIDATGRSLLNATALRRGIVVAQGTASCIIVQLSVSLRPDCSPIGL